MNRLPEFPNVEGQNSNPRGLGVGSMLASKLRMLVMSAIASGGVVGANGCLPEIESTESSCYVDENVGICLELCFDYSDNRACDIYCDVVTEEIYEKNKNAKTDDVRFPKCEKFIEADGFGGMGGNMDMGGDMRTDAFDLGVDVSVDGDLDMGTDGGDAETDADTDSSVIVIPMDSEIDSGMDAVVDADIDSGVDSEVVVIPMDSGHLGVDASIDAEVLDSRVVDGNLDGGDASDLGDAETDDSVVVIPVDRGSVDSEVLDSRVADGFDLGVDGDFDGGDVDAVVPVDANPRDAFLSVDANLDGSIVDSGRLDQGVGSDACAEDSGEICNDGGFVDAARPDLGDGDLDMGTDGGDASDLGDGEIDSEIDAETDGEVDAQVLPPLPDISGFINVQIPGHVRGQICRIPVERVVVTRNCREIVTAAASNQSLMPYCSPFEGNTVSLDTSTPIDDLRNNCFAVVLENRLANAAGYPLASYWSDTNGPFYFTAYGFYYPDDDTFLTNRVVSVYSGDPLVTLPMAGTPANGLPANGVPSDPVGKVLHVLQGRLAE